MNGVNLTPIINAVIALIGALLAAFVIPWLKRKMSQQDMNKMLNYVGIAVYAAQQLYYSKSGQERLKYVLDYLASLGYDVDDESVRNAIEAEVLKLHKQLEEKSA